MQIRAYPDQSYSCDVGSQARLNDVISRRDRFTGRIAVGSAALFLITIGGAFLRVTLVWQGGLALLLLAWLAMWFSLSTRWVRRECPGCHQRLRSEWIQDEEFLLCDPCHKYIYTHRSHSG
jgi:hypothetical protein